MTPTLGHQLLFARRDEGRRQIKVTPALTDSGTAAKILSSESVWELALDGKTVRAVPTDPPTVGDQESSLSKISSSTFPIVLLWEYADHSLNHLELAEEFRHYHDLAEDKDRGILIAFDGSGDEIVVANLHAAYVTVRKDYLMRFLAGTGYHLSLFLDLTGYEKASGTVCQGIQPINDVSDVCKKRDNLLSMDGTRGSTYRLLRKIAFSPPSRENSGIWPHAPVKRKITFVIGYDSIGNEVEDTAFHGGKKIVDSLTSIHFRGTVLDKYRACPEKYQVSPGMLACQDRWTCPIGISCDTDLVYVDYENLRGRIPPSEQYHWRQHNVAVRQVISCADPTQAIRGILASLLSAYWQFNSEWERVKGWRFFEKPRDLELFSEIETAPENKVQAAGWITALNILLGECVNVSRMKKEIAKLSRSNRSTKSQRGKSCGTVDAPCPRGDKGREKREGNSTIVKLYLECCGFTDADLVSDFIRDLADIRATVVHRRRARHETTRNRTGIDPSKDPGGGCLKLARRALGVIRSLEKHLQPTSKRADFQFDFIREPD